MLFEQKRFGHGKRSYKVLDKKRLKVKTSSIFGKNQEIYNLFDIDEKYDAYLERPLKWIAISLVFFGMTSLFIFEYIKTWDYGLLVVIALFLVPGLVCLQQYFHRVNDWVIFRYRNSGRPAFILWNNSPGKESFDKFLQDLAKTIEAINIDPSASDDKKLEIYKHYLEILLSEDVISEEEATEIYSRTKEKLIKNATILSIAK